MKTIFTTNNTLAEQINAPMLKRAFVSSRVWFPNGLEFNKTYYKEKNGNLVAFKVLAISFTNKDECNLFGGSFDFYHIVYLVQYADMLKPYWEKNTIEGKIFENKQHYFDYVMGKTDKCVDFKTRSIANSECGILISNGFHNRGEECGIRKTYRWSNLENKPTNVYTFIKSLIITSEGMVVCVDYKTDSERKYVNGFSNYEDCVKDHIGDMVVTEFEESKISLNIEVEICRPITHKIKIVEF